ncbi:hypothetical protein C8Q79DRAFT_995353 [Trametes meyenii]|nr:hypothetical protein C8Q79DRAFT_995353 [Trametes meyenii]
MENNMLVGWVFEMPLLSTVIVSPLCSMATSPRFSSGIKKLLSIVCRAASTARRPSAMAGLGGIVSGMKRNKYRCRE